MVKSFNIPSPPSTLAQPLGQTSGETSISITLQGRQTRTLGLLKQNLRVGDIRTKDMAYLSVVHLQVEYASPVWDTQTLNLTCQLEMVQRCAAWYICHRYHNTSSVTSMLGELGWKSLEERRYESMLTMLYKVEMD